MVNVITHPSGCPYRRGRMRRAKARIRDGKASFLQQPPDSETRRLITTPGPNVRPSRRARFRLGEARLPFPGLRARAYIGLAFNRLHLKGRWGSFVATL